VYRVLAARQVCCVVLQVVVALRLSLALNIVICVLGIFRVCLVNLSPAVDDDPDRDVIDDVTNHRRADNSASEFLVPNIVHYIWSVTVFVLSSLNSALPNT